MPENHRLEACARTLLSLIFIVLPGAFTADAAQSPIAGTRIEEIIDEVSKRQQKIETLKAEFRQEKELGMLAEPEVSTGVFYYSKPNRVRWEYETPDPVTMVIANGWLTTFYPELSRAEKLEVTRYEDRIFQYMGAAAGAIDDLARHFDFRFVDRKGERAWLLELTPKSRMVEKRIRSIRIWIDKDSYFTTAFEYVEGDGDLTRYEFDAIETNVPVSDTTFVIDLPAGVHLEEMKLNR